MKESNGTVKFLPHRHVYVGYWNGKIQCTKKGQQACRDFLNAKFGYGGIVTKALPVASIMPKAHMTTMVGAISTTEATLRTQVDAEWAKAKTMFRSIQHMPAPSISFYTRGKVAGRAWRCGSRVAFNSVLAVENPDTFINTVKHELAHLIVYATHPGASPHGHEFKRIFIAIGGNGKRCHNYDVSTVAVKRNTLRYEYRCDCQNHMMSSQRHGKAQRGARYTCRKCRALVVYSGKAVMN